jgi:putative transposase
VTAWQSRPLEPLYPVVFFDALRVKIRHEASVRIKAVYLALAVLPDGRRDMLGIWIEQTEGAKFWMKVFTDLKTRGCRDILIAVTDGLKGMEEALVAVFPSTTLQRCIVHLLRQSLDFAKLETTEAARRRVAYDLRSPERGPGPPCTRRVRARRMGPTPSARRRRLASRMGARDSVLRVSPEIRRVIYTTNALESVHAQLRKIVRTRGHFPHDDAATKLIWVPCAISPRNGSVPRRPGARR